MSVTETLWLDSTHDTPATTSSVLGAGQQYRFTVTGNCSYQDSQPADLGSPDAIMWPSPGLPASNKAGIDADVEYASSSAVDGGWTGSPRHSTRFRVDTGTTGLVHPEAEGGPFTLPQSGHVYTFLVTGEGQQADVWMFDSFRPDNNGMFKVEISPVTSGFQVGKVGVGPGVGVR